MTVFLPLGSSTFFDPQVSKVYAPSGVNKSDPFYSSPLDTEQAALGFLQKGDIYAAPVSNTLSNQITADIQQAQQNSQPSSTAAYTPSATVTQGSAAITAMMTAFQTQYQYSINGQADPTYEALAQTAPSNFTSIVKDARTSEVTQLATIAASGADAPTQAGQSAQARIGFLTGAAFELQSGVNTPATPASGSTAASGPPDPVTSASALNDLVTELQTSVQEFSSSGSTLTAAQSASFLQSAQSTVGTLQSVALALVPQMAAGTTPQYFNGNLFNATQNLASVEATLQSLTGASSASTPDSASADLGNTLNTSA